MRPLSLRPRLFLSLFVLIGQTLYVTPCYGVGTKFVAVGHLYPLWNHPQHVEALLKRIDEEHADYVFILGDAYLQHAEKVAILKEKIKTPIFFSPGNHDLEDHGATKEDYIKNIGYLQTTVVAKDLNFILINTQESASQLQSYLRIALSRVNPEQPTVLMGHHRIWDDHQLSSEPFDHEKSYLFGELLPLLRDRVQYLFAGNSTVQYFPGSKSMDVVYWVESHDGILCYSCGMGKGRGQATYIVAQRDEAGLSVWPRAVSFTNRTLATAPRPIGFSELYFERLQRYLARLLTHRFFWSGVLFSLLLIFPIQWLMRLRIHKFINKTKGEELS